MTPKSVLILGARSDIGRAVARRFAQSGASVILAARRADTLADELADLRIRFKVPAEAVEFDATDGAARSPETAGCRVAPSEAAGAGDGSRAATPTRRASTGRRDAAG